MEMPLPKALFIVESPLQFLNTIEAIETFKIQDAHVLVRISSEGNLKHIQNLLKMLPLPCRNRIVQVKISQGGKGLIDKVKILGLVLYFMFFSRQYPAVFIGDYKSGFISLFKRFFKKSKTILLDDGMTTVTIQEQFSNDKHMDFFTMFDLKPFSGQTIVCNAFTRIKRELNNTKKINRDLVVFIASPIDPFLSDPRDYIRLFEASLKRNKDKKMIYLLHRHETGIIHDLKSDIPFEIKQLDFPIEFYGLYEDELPGTFVGLVSTALITLNKIYPNTKSIAYKFDTTLFKEAWVKNETDNNFVYFEKHIEIQPLLINKKAEEKIKV